MTSALLALSAMIDVGKLRLLAIWLTACVLRFTRSTRPFVEHCPDALQSVTRAVAPPPASMSTLFG